MADGRNYGRGTADMKGGVAAMVYAVRALREAGVELSGDVTLETVIEEECTGNGALAARARGTDPNHYGLVRVSWLAWSRSLSKAESVS